MAQEINKPGLNNIFSKSPTNVKKECQDDYLDDKVSVSETAVSITGFRLNNYVVNDEISKCEVSPVDDIKMEFTSEEDKIFTDPIKTEFSNELLICRYCHEDYRDYCTKCKVLVHIVNQSTHYTSDDTVGKGLPKQALEIRESFGHLGVFALRMIPEGVRFGPFIGLNPSELPLRIKGGKFVVSDDKLNWMQCINPARDIFEQNLSTFQSKNKLYYCTTRNIQEGEKLLVYFRGEYKNILNQGVEMDFMPIVEKGIENVFACTFCCLGFSKKEYLAEHKTVSHNETNKMFLNGEIVQCQFCKVFLEKKEYLGGHMYNCCEKNIRHSVPTAPNNHMLETKEYPSLTNRRRRRQGEIYKCSQCKYKTLYKVDLKNHTNEHYKVKTYRCSICNKRFKTKESLKSHVEKIHIVVQGKEAQAHSTYDYLKSYTTDVQTEPLNSPGAQLRSLKRRFQIKSKHCIKSPIKTKHLKERNFKCMECDYNTKRKYYLKVHIKTKHLKEYDYNCTECEYKTNTKKILKVHIKTKHLKEYDYNCMECDFKTNIKLKLRTHMKSKHLKEYDFNCRNCEYKTNDKFSLRKHMKTNHLKESDYKCTECHYKTHYQPYLKFHIKMKHLKKSNYKCVECDYKTDYKPYLKSHIKLKHLKKSNYKCIRCDFKTSYKSYLKTHLKTVHLKESNYKCMECDYKTNYKRSLKAHIKTKHLKESDFKCIECDYKTNYKSSLKRHVKIKHFDVKDYKRADYEFEANCRQSCLGAHVKREQLMDDK